MSENNFKELLEKAVTTKKEVAAEQTGRSEIADAIIIASACGYVLSMIIKNCSGDSKD